MKKLILFLTFLPAITLADCFEYEVKGIVRTKGIDIVLRVHEGTSSQYEFVVPDQDAIRFSPLVGVTTKGTYLFANRPQSSDKILKTLNVERSFPDPLHPTKHNYLKLIGTSKCPQ